MKTTITSRHGDVPDALRARAVTLLERLGKRAKRLMSAAVTFDRSNQLASAEFVLTRARGEPIVARADATDHRSALDRAAAKIRRQLDKPVTSRRRLAAGRK